LVEDEARSRAPGVRQALGLDRLVPLLRVGRIGERQILLDLPALVAQLAERVGIQQLRLLERVSSHSASRR
jgi:hypothetical protein